MPKAVVSYPVSWFDVAKRLKDIK